MRFFYRDWRPTLLGRALTGALAWLSAKGLGPKGLVTLKVKGRKSGRLRRSVLVATTHEGRLYLVSMLGDRSEWVQNARAARGEAWLEHGATEPVRLTELPVAERAPILQTYCQVATSGRTHFPVAKDEPIAAFHAIAGDFPVFLVEPR